MLDMAKQLGTDSVTLRDKLQRAEELRTSGRMDEATFLADEVVSYGRSVVSSEIDRQLTDLMQRAANDVPTGNSLKNALTLEVEPRLSVLLPSPGRPVGHNRGGV